MNNRDARIEANTDYVIGELARAFTTAVCHEDDATRQRAESRVARWREVIAGMAAGAIRVGSRQPVVGLPVWATPKVLRGGFATGSAAAGGPARPHEVEVARRAGVPWSRRAVFGYYLTDAGLAELFAMLDSGSYQVTLPEEAALLTAAWLVRIGDRSGALALLDQLEPYAHTLCFAPVPDPTPVLDPTIVWRETAGDAHAAVSGRGLNVRVETHREALTVWNPFTDEVLALWLEVVDTDGHTPGQYPREWITRGAGLLARYRVLAAAHTRCGKHRRPKENLAVLRSALEEVVGGRELSGRQRGLLRHVIVSMVRRRGVPGSAEHVALRARQTAEAAVPTHHMLARVVATRLAALPPGRGVRCPDELTRPVLPSESGDFGVPEGALIPPTIRLVVERAFAGTVEELIDRGVVPSAEVLALLVPQIGAATSALVYPDGVLRALMAATYTAFRSRRSLLLLNLAHQVRLEELPWVAAVAPYRRGDDHTRADAHATLVRLGGLALSGFPATVLPNRLIRELAALSQQADLDLPWVEELAADIFMGTFSTKFLAAAKIAGRQLGGSLYERYYGIDYAGFSDLPDTGRRRWWGVRTSEAFDTLCHSRAGAAGIRSVAANGMVIEQAQILTTHNLATLVGPVGVAPTVGWLALARRTFSVVCQLVAQVQYHPRPLGTIKNAAYAWRHTLFFLSMASDAERDQFLRAAHDDLRAVPGHAAMRLRPVIIGLEHVNAGGQFDAEGIAGEGRRYLGWAVNGHWMRPNRRTHARH